MDLGEYYQIILEIIENRPWPILNTDQQFIDIAPNIPKINSNAIRSYLTSIGDQVNALSVDNYSLLHIVIEKYNSPQREIIAELLLQAGANPNTCSNDGSTPLSQSIFDTKQYILKKIDKQSTQTYPHFCTSVGNQKTSQLTKLLIDFRADPNLGSDVTNCLVRAARDRQTDTFRMLLQANADPNILVDSNNMPSYVMTGRDPSMKIPLIFDLAFNGMTKLAEMLIENGANPETPIDPSEPGERKLLFYLIIFYKEEYRRLIQLLLEKGANPYYSYRTRSNILCWLGTIREFGAKSINIFKIFKLYHPTLKIYYNQIPQHLVKRVQDLDKSYAIAASIKTSKVLPFIPQAREKLLLKPGSHYVKFLESRATGSREVLSESLDYFGLSNIEDDLVYSARQSDLESVLS